MTTKPNRRKRKAASMAVTSLLATSALLGTYLGNPRLNRAYASGVCNASNTYEFDLAVSTTSCTIINITSSFTASPDVIVYRTIGSTDPRSTLSIVGPSDGARISGGAYQFLRIEKNLELSISNLTISDFESSSGSSFYTKGNLTIENSHFKNNDTQSDGGAVFVVGDLNVTNSSFIDNFSSNQAGAIYVLADLILTNSTFSGNYAGGTGGAIYSNGNVTITNSTFSENVASLGGAIGMDSGALTVKNSTFQNNSSSFGGAAYVLNGDINLTNSIFSDNTASSKGGAVYLERSGASSGAYTITLKSSIFETSDTINDNGANIDLLTFIPDGVIVADPLLGSLQDNDGPTLTMLPSAGSPAIDAGDNSLIPAGVTTDQRGTGFARIAGASVDMGAVEVQAASGTSGGWDGSGLNSLTSVILQDQSGLDKTWSDHDILLNSLQKVLNEKPNSDLKVLADGIVRLTAFIPTDRAFRRFAFDLTGIRPRNDKQTMRVIDSLDLETIEKVLLYHVVLGDPISSEEALKANGVFLTTLSGDTFRLRVTNKPNIFLRDKNKDLKNPKVLLKRVDINDGNRQVAHVINRVLIPMEEIR